MEPNRMSRRRFLAGVAAGVAAGSLARDGLAALAAQPAGRGARPVAPLQALRERAAAKGLFYGTAATAWVLQHQPDLAARVAAECGLLVPESELKWARVHPGPNHYEFAAADWLRDFAGKHDMRLRGHTLLYFQNEPAWVAAGSAAEVERTVEEHVRTVAGHYKGAMHSWDVVNEILELNDHRPDGLRKTPLLDRLGPDFVPIAFRAAAQADPAAILCWNENQLEYDVPYQAARRERVLRLLDDWRRAGVPIQALGIQSHLRQHATKFDAKQYRAFLHDVAALGMKLIVSELDVFDADLPADPATRDRAVADAYAEYLAAALDEPAVLGVVTWGLSDRSTWLSSYRPRKNGAEARPLPLDAALAPTAAYEALGRAFDAARARP
jgi:endo-1,4-beta-xylanase